MLEFERLSYRDGAGNSRSAATIAAIRPDRPPAQRGGGSLQAVWLGHVMINDEQLSLTKEELRCNQLVRPDVPLELLRLALVTRPTAVNLLNSVLANVACKPR